MEPTVAETRQTRDLLAAVRALHWRGALREFVVILAGVLGALAAQAWWQGRQDAARERDYLRQLLADTRENEHRLDAAIRGDSISQRGLARLTNTLYGTAPLPVADSIYTLFDGSVFSSSEFQPLAGSLTALVAAGDLRLIRTDSLRSQLVAYAARLESERESLNFYQSQAFGDPGRIARTLPFVRAELVDRPFRVRTRALPPLDVRRLRDDPELAAIVFSLRVANLNRVAHLRRMREHTVRLRRALEAESAGGETAR